MLVEQGEKIKDRVREFFKKGHKSGNKLYSVNIDGEPDLTAMSQKGNKRLLEAEES